MTFGWRWTSLFLLLSLISQAPLQADGGDGPAPFSREPTFFGESFSSADSNR